MKHQKGFTLVEIVAVLVILGIVAVLATLFFSTGVGIFSQGRAGSEAALRAGVALDRIALELKGSTITASTANASVSYTSGTAPLSGNRSLSFAAVPGELVLTVDGTGYTLLSGVSSPVLTVTMGDLDNDGTASEVSAVTVGFDIAVGSASKSFSTVVYPRNF